MPSGLKWVSTPEYLSRSDCAFFTWNESLRLKAWEEKGRAQGALRPLLMAANASSLQIPELVGEEQPWCQQGMLLQEYTVL